MTGRMLIAAACAFFIHAAWAMDVHVINAATGAPVPAATVTVAGAVISTDDNGDFDVEVVDDPIQVRAPGYRALSTSPALLAETDHTIRLQPLSVKALYLSMYGVGHKPKRDAALKLLEDAPVNALVIDIKSDEGLIPYPSALPLATEVGARRVTTISNLRALVDRLHESGIYAIARIVVFKDELLAAARPELAVRREDGAIFRDREGQAWTDPFLQEVLDYNLAVAVEAALAGFDEIQFDYVRFPDAPGLRFAQPSTQDRRVEAIGMLLAQAREALIPHNVYLSVDVFGYVCWNTDDTQIGQRLEDLLPLVDYISPMLYPSSFQAGIPGIPDPVAHPERIVQRSLENAIARTKADPRRFRPWLQAFRDYAFDRRAFDADVVVAQINAVEATRAGGWMLWNPRNVYPEAEPLSGAGSR